LDTLDRDPCRFAAFFRPAALKQVSRRPALARQFLVHEAPEAEALHPAREGELEFSPSGVVPHFRQLSAQNSPLDCVEVRVFQTVVAHNLGFALRTPLDTKLCTANETPQH